MRGLEPIRSLEDYNLAKKRLEYYVSEYLTTKKNDIDKGEYKQKLKRNINGLILKIEHFEAVNQNVKFGDLVKGILRGDKEINEYLKKKYTFILANLYGTAPEPESLNVESMSDILDYMDKYYDFVDIDLSDREKKPSDLVVVSQEADVGLRNRVIEMTNKRADEVIRNAKVSGDIGIVSEDKKAQDNRPRLKDEKVVSREVGKDSRGKQQRKSSKDIEEER